MLHNGNQAAAVEEFHQISRYFGQMTDQSVDSDICSNDKYLWRYLVSKKLKLNENDPNFNT